MNKKRMLLSGAACIAFALPAMGQTSLEEIVVTAQKRSESLQDVPVTMTALTAETLEKLDVREHHRRHGQSGAQAAEFFPVL
jgi:iron complex outermembrane receptor protein